MPDFPLTLALYNSLPVALTGLALWYLARLALDLDRPHGRLAVAGSGMILAGGLAKATWKLVAALTGADLAWLGGALFPLLAPGFALLAAALWGATGRLRGRAASAWPRRAALAAIGVACAVALLRQWLLEIPRGWFLPLLVLASLGNLLLSVRLIVTALRLRRLGIALLFAVNLAMIFALQPIAMANPKTLAMHWIEQTLTVLGVGCFALGAYRLWRLGRAIRP